VPSVRPSPFLVHTLVPVIAQKYKPSRTVTLGRDWHSAVLHAGVRKTFAPSSESIRFLERGGLPDLHSAELAHVQLRKCLVTSANPLTSG